MIEFTEKLEKLFGSWNAISDVLGSNAEITARDLLDEISDILIYNR